MASGGELWHKLHDLLMQAFNVEMAGIEAAIKKHGYLSREHHEAIRAAPKEVTLNGG